MLIKNGASFSLATSARVSLKLFMSFVFIPFMILKQEPFHSDNVVLNCFILLQLWVSLSFLLTLYWYTT